MEIQELVQESSSPYYDDNNEKRHLEAKTTDAHFVVDDLLDFPNDDVEEEVAGDTPSTTTDSSTALDDSSNSSPHHGSLGGDEEGSGSFVDTQLSNLYVPNDDLAEFEWLSNFMEDSFSNEDLQKLQLISGVKAPSKFGFHHTTTATTKENNNKPMFNNDIMTVPGKARTKRSRAVSSNWASSQLQVISPIAHISSSYHHESNNIVSKAFGKKKLKTATTNDKEFHDRSYRNEDGRKCLHCATDKTPQWRSGPMGPKTLCNACGVRYKSGRLVPEYRPASSPTFVLTKHSNSHRKVLELQRQKVQKSQHHQQFMHQQNAMIRMHDGDDYMMNQNTNHDYRQLI
uniref:GATA transcription factor 9-like n=1 Tax=Erigeron canadensis TaxID=72917 RepID=UPI001CB97B1C|nr:GATA transcription factor 9-like [Erigeron canadensis]